MNLVDKITKKQIRTDIPEFRVGDTVKLNLKIDEKDSRGNIKTVTVRKVSGNVGTEKTLPVNSPRIDSIEVVRKGKVRRAKLNYIRDLKKTPKIKERADKKELKEESK